MDIVIDTRPAAQLSDSEIVACLFRELRACQYRTARQVQASVKRMFPDLPPDRARDCLAQLAQALS